MLLANIKQRGRPRSTTPDNRPHAQILADRREKRREKGLKVVESLPRLPDTARVPFYAIEVALNQSGVTIWRRIKDGKLPPFECDGKQRYYRAGVLRQILGGEK